MKKLLGIMLASFVFFGATADAQQKTVKGTIKMLRGKLVLVDSTNKVWNIADDYAAKAYLGRKVSLTVYPTRATSSEVQVKAVSLVRPAEPAAPAAPAQGAKPAPPAGGEKPKQ